MLSQTMRPTVVSQTPPKIYISSWVDINNIKDNDGVCSTCRVSNYLPNLTYCSYQALYSGGSPHELPGGSSSVLLANSLTWNIYGSPTELWGLSLTPELVNSAEFGCYLGFQGNAASSTNIYPSSFGFSIPDGSSIDGVEIYSYDMNSIVIPDGYAAIDVVVMKVYYTPRNTIIGVGTITGVGSITL
jgi:hypothetical protein